MIRLFSALCFGKSREALRLQLLLSNLYWKSFVNHLRSYASWACEELCLNSSSLVVDIGSNDGTCLSFFKDLGTQVVGVDPASVLGENR